MKWAHIHKLDDELRYCDVGVTSRKSNAAPTLVRVEIAFNVQEASPALECASNRPIGVSSCSDVLVEKTQRIRDNTTLFLLKATFWSFFGTVIRFTSRRTGRHPAQTFHESEFNLGKLVRGSVSKGSQVALRTSWLREWVTVSSGAEINPAHSKSSFVVNLEFNERTLNSYGFVLMYPASVHSGAEKVHFTARNDTDRCTEMDQAYRSRSLSFVDSCTHKYYPLYYCHW